MTGQEIKEARLKKGLSQRELAIKIGVTESRVSRWENGKNKPHHLYEEKLKKELE